MIEQEKPDESLLRTIEKLLDVNYAILALLDKRLIILEDYIDLENKKKKGNCAT